MFDAVTEWIGVSPTAEMWARLDTYTEWLRHEALPAGGLGPAEGRRLQDRHVGDSLLFAGVWDRTSMRPVLDVGSGAGLPGIPLAIMHPQRQFRLLDRAGRRVQLLRRALRVLELPNAVVEHGDVVDADWEGLTVVSRASLTPERWGELVKSKHAPAELLVGGSHRHPPVTVGFETVTVPPEILDRPVWILRMERS